MNCVSGEEGRLDLSVHINGVQRSHPQNALITALVQIRNIGNSPLLLAHSVVGNPMVEVLDDRERAVYPLELQYPAGSYGPRPSRDRVLLPGATMEQQQYVVLLAPTVRAVLYLDGPGVPKRIDGEALILELEPAEPPRVVLRSSPEVHAEVARPVGATGDLLYIDETVCTTVTGGTRFSGAARRSWRKSESTVLTPDWAPDCREPRQWNAVAGWINYPVAFINYSS